MLDPGKKRLEVIAPMRSPGWDFVNCRTLRDRNAAQYGANDVAIDLHTFGTWERQAPIHRWSAGHVFCYSSSHRRSRLTRT
jgi:hypothetical protein